MRVLEKLSTAVNTHAHELVSEGEARSLSSVAWIVRSIFELLIWMEYCGKSAENAMNFYVDAERF
jgi:hypothetical protein